MICQFQRTETGIYCPHCKRGLDGTWEKLPQRQCTTTSFVGRVKSYTEAVYDWNKAGRPTRSDEDVKRIYEEKCKPCERFFKGTCSECGCKVNKSGVPLINKIKMGTESCPLKKW